MDSRKTLVINFFAGAAAGKTTCAWETAAELKKLNIVAEYVPEYAKELVWDGKIDLLDGSYKNQTAMFKEQKRRLDRLVGKVDVIVTDSPLLLQVAYIKENAKDFESMAVVAHGEYNNFNLFINRGKVYEQEGRIHSLSESQKVDKSIKNILERNGIYYGNYYHITIPVVIENIQTTLKKLQERPKPPMREQFATAEEKARVQDAAAQTVQKGRGLEEREAR